MHALTLLKTDHRKVEQLFKQFEKTENPTRRRAIVDKIIKELAIHAAIEEQVFYPAVRNAIQKAQDTVLESLEEHHVVKWMLSELDGMNPEAERFEAKVTVLIENVRHHVKDEETEMFPMVRKKLAIKELNALGNAMVAAKRIAPKRPHPRAPDTPPANLIAGMGAGLVDRAREAVRGLAKAGARRARSVTPRRGRSKTTTRRGTTSHRAAAH